jgi:predicted alpha/beta superfamily hydrolase
MSTPGTLQRHAQFPSRLVAPRTVEVWLPPHYGTEIGSRWPVIYMHDGQNLFDRAVAFGGIDWGVGEALARLVKVGLTDGAIVVGIWNTGEGRWREYMPQKALGSRAALARFRGQVGGAPLSDRYLRFLVHEVKPFVDSAYRTLGGRENTFVMGSSMGGLASLYAVCEYPHVFRGAGCLSTHWPAGDGAVINYVRRALPSPGRHRFYFDYGTETLDAEYEAYQKQADTILRAAGYREGVDWVTRRFPDAEHSERSWRERVHIPLLFLLEGKSA